MRAIFIASVAIVAMAALIGPAEAAHRAVQQPRTTSLDGRLTCTAGGECVYTVRNTGPSTSYVSYGSEEFGWGSAHFAGGGCLAPGASLRQVSYTHDAHGNPVIPATSVSAPFLLPYVPHDNRC